MGTMRKRGKADLRERFGFAVKLRREELGLTQEELAESAGIHRTYLSDIERGMRNASLLNIERLARRYVNRSRSYFGQQRRWLDCQRHTEAIDGPEVVWL